MSECFPVPQTEFLVYLADGGGVRVQVRLHDETVWLTQATMAELYQTTPQNISMHLKAIYEEGELDEGATCKDFLQVRTEGNRSLKRNIKHYRLEVVLAVGYRVKSPRATQFRQWATTVLREFLVKGFAMNDERLKEPAWDYFDELLERIRDIRASEKRFYQKVRDLFAFRRIIRMTHTRLASSSPRFKINSCTRLPAVPQRSWLSAVRTPTPRIWDSRAGRERLFARGMWRRPRTIFGKRKSSS